MIISRSIDNVVEVEIISNTTFASFIYLLVLIDLPLAQLKIVNTINMMEVENSNTRNIHIGTRFNCTIVCLSGCCLFNYSLTVLNNVMEVV